MERVQELLPQFPCLGVPGPPQSPAMAFQVSHPDPSHPLPHYMVRFILLAFCSFQFSLPHEQQHVQVHPTFSSHHSAPGSETGLQFASSSAQDPHLFVCRWGSQNTSFRHRTLFPLTGSCQLPIHFPPSQAGVCGLVHRCSKDEDLFNGYQTAY